MAFVSKWALALPGWLTGRECLWGSLGMFCVDLYFPGPFKLGQLKGHTEAEVGKGFFSK